MTLRKRAKQSPELAAGFCSHIPRIQLSLSALKCVSFFPIISNHSEVSYFKTRSQYANLPTQTRSAVIISRLGLRLMCRVENFSLLK